VGYYGYQTTTTRRISEEKLGEATRLIEQVDEAVIAVDEVIRAEITPEIGERAAELTPTVEPAIATLGDALDLIGEAKPGLPEERAAEADALRVVAETRIRMLEIAPPILEANTAAAAALAPAEAAWALVLEGEKLADDAVIQYNKLTKESVTESKKLTTNAQAKLKEAKTGFQEAQSLYATPDFKVYVTYIDAKLALLAISIKADDAFLKGDPAGANTVSNEYNAKEKDVIAKAKLLPETPARAIADAYEADAGEPTQDYFEARDAATRADKALGELEE